jgi:hypothetical protein
VTVAAVAQLVERILGKDEVMGPIPISSLQDAKVSKLALKPPEYGGLGVKTVKIVNL